MQAYLRAYAALVNHSSPVGSGLALTMASIAAQGLFLVFMCLEALQAGGGVELAVDSTYLPEGVGAVLKEVASSPAVRPT